MQDGNVVLRLDGRLVASDGLQAETRSLVEAYFDVATVPLSEFLDGPVLDGPIFYLLDGGVETDELVDALVCLQTFSSRLGVIPCTSTAATRRWLEKIRRSIFDDQSQLLLNPKEIEIQTPDARLSEYGFSTVSDRQARVRSKSASVERAQLILLSGHSNQVDGGFGGGVLACSRKHSRPVSDGRNFPCHYDGRCFRLPDRPDSASISDHLHLSAIGAKLAILLGCNLISTRRGWFDPSDTLLDDLAHSDVGAAVASLGTMSYAPGIELLLLACLADGNHLGQAVDFSNQLLADIGGATGLPSKIGPLFVIGDPTIKVHGLPPPRAIVFNDELAMTFPLNRDESSPFAFFHVEGGPFAVKNVPICVYADGAHTRAVRSPRSGGYLWYSIASGQSSSVLHIEPLKLGKRDQSEWEVLFAGCSEWEILLREISRYAKSRMGNTNAVEAVLELNANLKENVESWLVKLWGGDGNPAVVHNYQHDGVGTLDVEFDLLEDLRIEVVASLVNTIGTRLFHLWMDRAAAVAVDRKTCARCLCGGTLYATLYRWGVPSFKRSIFSCPVCGPVAELPSEDSDSFETGRLLSDMGHPVYDLARRAIEWEIGSSNTSNLTVVLAIQDWNKESSLMTSAHKVLRGEPIKLLLPFPETIVQGAYPVALLCSRGGRFGIIRHMLAIGGASSI